MPLPSARTALTCKYSMRHDGITALRTLLPGSRHTPNDSSRHRTRTIFPTSAISTHPRHQGPFDRDSPTNVNMTEIPAGPAKIFGRDNRLSRSLIRSNSLTVTSRKDRGNAVGSALHAAEGQQIPGTNGIRSSRNGVFRHNSVHHQVSSGTDQDSRFSLFYHSPRSRVFKHRSTNSPFLDMYDSQDSNGYRFTGRKSATPFENPWPSARADTSFRLWPASKPRLMPSILGERRIPELDLAAWLMLSQRPDFDKSERNMIYDRYSITATWIGHCTFVLHLDGLTILTDPVWTSRLGPNGSRRAVPPPCEIDDLPRNIDIVLLSSACPDNYDERAVSRLIPRVVQWFVPCGMKSMLMSCGVDFDSIVELNWWEEAPVADTIVVCTPSQHHSPIDGVLWCSWLINTPAHRVFFCGGTGYSAVAGDRDDIKYYEERVMSSRPTCPAFSEVYERYGSCDLALLPMGGARPRAIMSGINSDPVDLLCIHNDLHARRTIAHRWGTFLQPGEGLLSPMRTLDRVMLDSPFPEQSVTYLRTGHRLTL